MNRLRYPYKLALICLLFTLPLFIVSSLLISEINAQIDFSHKELRGNKYFRSLIGLLDHTLQARLTAQSVDLGRITGLVELSSLQTQIDSDLRAVESVDQELGAEMETSRRLKKLATNWQLLKDTQLDQNAADKDALYVQAIERIGGLISRVGDSSNLVLDSSLDVYYPINSLLLKLPEVERLLVQAQCLGQSVLATKSMSEKEHDQFISFSGMIRMNLRDIEKGMDVAFHNNPADNLKRKLEGALTDFRLAVSTFLVFVEKELLHVPDLGLEPATLDAHAGKAVRESFRLWELAEIEVDALLQNRIHDLTRKKRIIETVCLSVMLLIAYLLIGFYGSVMRTVTGLEAATQRMLEGDLVGHVVLETRDELTHVVHSFNSIADRLRRDRDHTEEVNAELEAFAYSVSHDLRAPLRALQGISQALLEDYGSQMDATAQDYSRRLVAAAAEMENLIQDLLAYSRLSRIDIHLASIDLKDAIMKAQGQLSTNIQESQAQISMDNLGFTVLAHPITLVQILTNLLSNAVKFVKPGVKPLVNVTAYEHEGRVRLCVDDNGIGIAPDYQERIFGVFERLHGVEEYAGSGIGLAIVRKGVTRMGGRFGVISQVGQGSRFWIELSRGMEKTREP